MIRFLIVMAICNAQDKGCRQYDFAEYNNLTMCVRDAKELDDDKVKPNVHLWCEIDEPGHKRERVKAYPDT